LELATGIGCATTAQAKEKKNESKGTSLDSGKPLIQAGPLIQLGKGGLNIKNFLPEVMTNLPRQSSHHGINHK